MLRKWWLRASQKGPSSLRPGYPYEAADHDFAGLSLKASGGRQPAGGPKTVAANPRCDGV